MHVAEDQKIDDQKEIVAVIRESGVALVILDAPVKFNSLGTRTNAELGKVLDELEANPAIKASVFISGKPDSFVIGADLVEIRRAQTREELVELSRSGQEVFNRLSACPKPVVAAIHGTCLGGGLELALACSYRIATDAQCTLLGMPETKLGIIPGLGGTQRLPAQVGLKIALEMILSGDPIDVHKALEYGLIEQIVPPDDLIAYAEKEALRLAEERSLRCDNSAVGGAELAGQDTTPNKDKPGTDDRSCAPAGVSGTGIKATLHCKNELPRDKATKLIAITQRAIRLRTRGNYPAQDKAIEAIQTGLDKGLEAGLIFERNAFAELAAGDVSGNLMSLFLNAEFARASAKQLAKKFPQSPVSTVAILGAGKMGTSVAQLAASHAVKAIIRTEGSKESKVLERVASLAKIFQKQANNKSDPHFVTDLAQVVANVEIATEDDALNQADLIVECVLEDTEVKHRMLERCSDKAGPGAVIASNTSALSITELSHWVAAPERFVGLHFFHPVDKMPLVEVVAHSKTERAALARAVDFVTRIGKTPLMVKDGPGFLINRLLVPYLIEVGHLVEEGVPANWIEEAAIDFGMPMGPFQLIDEVGIEVTFSVAFSLPPRLGRFVAPSILERTAKLNLAGKEGDRGFYLWEGGEKRLGFNPELIEKCGYVISPDKCTDEQKKAIIERMVLVMIDEAAHCLQEKIVAKPRDIDMGVVLGIGFPAFRGGVLRYADKLGVDQVLKKLETIYGARGGDRAPCVLLQKYASEGRGFYSLGQKDE